MRIRKSALAAAAAGTLLLAGTGMAAAVTDDGAKATATATASGPEQHGDTKPTIVLVHGAFEDASSYSGVIERLQADGYQVVAPATPLRGLAEDSDYLTDVVREIDAPVVLVGHSYGGMLISEVAARVPTVRGLVYAAAFIPQKGESVGELNAKFPGSLLGPDTTHTVEHASGPELNVKPESFRTLFAADRPARDAAVAAATQRPVAAQALADTQQHTAPADIPEYAVVATQDKAIPPAVQTFMADRAGALVWKVRSAHDVPASHPSLLTSVIEKAARSDR